MKRKLDTTIPGIALVKAGLVLFASTQLGFVPFADAVHWSLFIIAPGALLVFAGLTVREFGQLAATLGSVVLATGLVLAYQDWFDHFQNWAYAWILVGPVAVGAAWQAVGVAHGKSDARKDGRALVGYGLLAFIVAAAFFELVIGISGFGVLPRMSWGVVASLCLILAGIALILTSVRSTGSLSSRNSEDGEKK
ncbi:hypothetical protein [Pacificoceanicola onchidii]|uniref:hypothetical protein n=1 Tax=Pacificoceanicola onchidii TaxID=2562685 RepID=UPI0010A68843|nr:hypothetical protein [Pacificoceanicola onchidii]